MSDAEGLHPLPLPEGLSRNPRICFNTAKTTVMVINSNQFGPSHDRGPFLCTRMYQSVTSHFDPLTVFFISVTQRKLNFLPSRNSLHNSHCTQLIQNTLKTSPFPFLSPPSNFVANPIHCFHCFSAKFKLS
ncbi:hypothetical protein VNO80_20703 [Phaseolus coccineus]|uniref:Uncharacterized protein n=1 Tax=Phaseolus coccineus TaxID=3886 RepID=A0AAN9QWZ2_PHACN